METAIRIQKSFLLALIEKRGNVILYCGSFTNEFAPSGMTFLAREICAAIHDDESRYGRGGLFDCGELGCCLMYSTKMRLAHRWYELEKPPRQIGMEVAERPLGEMVEKRIEQIFLDIAREVGSDDSMTKAEAAGSPMMLFRASNAMVQAWREFLEALE
jgi:hypothetical protein